MRDGKSPWEWEGTVPFMSPVLWSSSVVTLMVGGVHGNSWPEVRLSILVLKSQIPPEAKNFRWD